MSVHPSNQPPQSQYQRLAGPLCRHFGYRRTSLPVRAHRGRGSARCIRLRHQCPSPWAARRDTGTPRGSLSCSSRTYDPAERPGRDAMQHDAQQHRESDCADGPPDRLGLAELLECQEREDDRGQAPGSEPTQEQDGRPVQSGSHQRERDRHDAYDGQAQRRVHEHRQVEEVERDRHQGCSEQEPHSESQDLSDELGQLPGSFDVALRRRSARTRTPSRPRTRR